MSGSVGVGQKDKPFSRTVICSSISCMCERLMTDSGCRIVSASLFCGAISDTGDVSVAIFVYI